MTQFITPEQTPLTPEPKVRKDVANIFFLLDRSGSMGHLVEQAIEGFNKFISNQKELGGKTKVSLIQFESVRRPIYEAVDINEVPLLTRETYRTGGGTALNDTVGYVLSEQLALCSPDETNIMAIFTDGQENGSREYSGAAVHALIQDAQAKGWEVLFLGANMNKADVVRSYGIDASNVATFDYSAKGVGDAFGTLSAVSTSYRGMKAAGNMLGRVNTEAVYAQTAAIDPAAAQVDISALFPASAVQGGLSAAVAQARAAIKPDEKK